MFNVSALVCIAPGNLRVVGEQRGVSLPAPQARFGIAGQRQCAFRAGYLHVDGVRGKDPKHDFVRAAFDWVSAQNLKWIVMSCAHQALAGVLQGSRWHGWKLVVYVVKA